MSGSTSLTIGIAIAVPAHAILAGCLLATCRAPGLELRSVIRHFTAGVMYAAGAEVLPDLLHRTGTASAVRVIAGVPLGVAAMIAIRAFSGWLKSYSLLVRRCRPTIGETHGTPAL